MRNLIFSILFLLAANIAFASKTVLINGKEIKNVEMLHKTMAKDLSFPKFYGNNLDALYEVLITDLSTESIIKIKNLNILEARLGRQYIQSFLETVRDASEQNTRIILLVE
jgi:ribonuclease inhibitor